MTDLYVDTDGVNRLYNQLRRASEDAAEALGYVDENCHINFGNAGIIMYWLGPQDHILDQVQTSLKQIRDISATAATEINKAQVMYFNTDHDEAAEIDTICTGVKDPAELRGLVSKTRAEAESFAQPFADTVEPTQYLRGPEYMVPIEMWSLNPLADLVSPTAWVRETCIKLFGKDPFEYWTNKLAGNWQAFVHVGNAIGQVGALADGISRNLSASVIDVTEAWRGNASEGFQEFEVNLSINIQNVSDACRAYSQAYMDTADVVKKLYDLISGRVMDLYDALIVVSGGLAAGTATISTVFGGIAGYGTAAYFSWVAYDIYQAISDFWGAAEDAVKAITAAVTGVQTNFGIKDMPGIQPYHHPALN